MTRTVVGLYEDLGAAQEAVRDLVDGGFHRDDISLVAKDGENRQVPGLTDTSVTAASQGAGTGAVLGGLAGLLVGLGALAIPGIGPIIAAGPLAATLAGAGVGAIAGGLAGALMDAGVPQHQAEQYAEGVRRGGTLVIIRTSDAEAGRAQSVLERHGAADIRTRASGWQQEARRGVRETPEEAAAPDRQTFAEQPDAPYATSPTQVDDWIGPAPTGEEGGQPTLRANLTTEAAPSGSDGAEPGDRAIDRAAGTMREDIAARGEAEREPTHAELPRLGADEARQDAEIGRSEGSAAAYRSPEQAGQPRSGPQPGWNTAREYDALAGEFREHYEMTYAAAGPAARYERYEPAYRFGYELAANEGSRVRKWSEVEPEARESWERRYPNEPWDNFREAVRRGWERGTAAGGSAPGSMSQGSESAGWAGPSEGGRPDRPSYQGPEDRRV